MNTSKVSDRGTHRPGKTQLELRRHSPRRSSGVLRTFVYGLGRKVAPKFCQSLRSLAKFCHAFRARTLDCFLFPAGLWSTHANKSACTRFGLLYTLRGAKVQPSLLLFGCAFVPSGSPRNPARQPGRTYPHKVSALNGKRFSRVSLPFDERHAFARVIPAFPSVMQVGSVPSPTGFTCIPLVKPGLHGRMPTML